MKIVIISGSTRDSSNSRRVSNYLSSRLNNIGVVNTILDLYEKQLPIYNATSDGCWKKPWEGMSQTLEKSDGLIFVSPEWDGMFSVGLHNLFHYVKKELADKPVLPVAVSTGRGGRYPLLQMRMMGYKNKHFVVIPESIFIDQVEKVLVNDVLLDRRVADRTDYALKVLIEYTKALTTIRKSGVMDYEKFPHGL